MKQDGFLLSAALVVGLLPMGTVSYSTPVYREPTRVQNQVAPPRKSQDFSNIFSGVDRVFEEMNKGAYYVGKQWFVGQSGIIVTRQAHQCRLMNKTLLLVSIPHAESPQEQQTNAWGDSTSNYSASHARGLTYFSLQHPLIIICFSIYQ
jgi:hypothetical protein